MKRDDLQNLTRDELIDRVKSNEEILDSRESQMIFQEAKKVRTGTMPRPMGVKEYRAMQNALFPGKPSGHSQLCRCALCREYYGDEGNNCFRSGCKLDSYAACRKGFCVRDHEKELESCKPIVELI